MALEVRLPEVGSARDELRGGKIGIEKSRKGWRCMLLASVSAIV